MELANSGCRIKSIRIKERVDFIIIENGDGTDVKKGSRFFCGCCGQPVGIAKEAMKFPFDSMIFFDNLEDKSIARTFLGLYHMTCHHVLFTFKPAWRFIASTHYFREMRNRVIRSTARQN